MSITTPPLSLRFSATNVPRKSPVTGKASRIPADKPDPKAGHFNARTAERVFMMLLGTLSAVGLYNSPQKLEAWSQQRLEADNNKQPVTLVQEPAVEIPAEAANAFAKTFLAVKKAPLMSPAMDFLSAMWMWQSAMLVYAVSQKVKKKSITPKELYRELHKMGLTGEGVKVGVVDTGYKPTPSLKANRVDFRKVEDLDTPTTPDDHSTMPHGTQTSNIPGQVLKKADFHIVSLMSAKEKTNGAKATSLIEQLLPGAKTVLSAVMTDKNVAEKTGADTLEKFYKEGWDNPDAMTIDKLRLAYRDTIEDIAKSVRNCIDNDCKVVNVSLGVEQAVQMNLMATMIIAKLVSKFLNKFMPDSVKESEDYRKTFGKFDQFQKKLEELKNANIETERVDDELKELYRPWIEVLDYAAKKNVAVVVSAGNDGGHKAERGDVLGHMNLFGLVDHPALFMIGSTNSDEIPSDFTSEWNDELHPLVAANGDGELIVEPHIEERGALSKFLAPFAGYMERLKHEDPRGTSFSAPDVTALIGALKYVNPNLSLREIRHTLQTTAKEAKFSPKQLAVLTKEVDARLEALGLDVNEENRQAELEKELRRRVGAGEVERGNAYKAATRMKR